MEFVTSWQEKGAEAERRKVIFGLLRLRFGNLDAELEAIIPQLRDFQGINYSTKIKSQNLNNNDNHYEGEEAVAVGNRLKHP